MSRHPDPYTNIIPGFIPTEQLTREWAEEHLGKRLEDFARHLADAVIAPNFEQQPTDKTAINAESQEGT